MDDVRAWENRAFAWMGGHMANCTRCGTAIVTEAGICGSCGTAVPAAWKFSWSPFIGIMYGPVPVGLIFAIIVLLAVYK